MLLTDKEVLNFLKKIKNDKTPGSDGSTCEFLKLLFYKKKKNIGSFVTRAINKFI